MQLVSIFFIALILLSGPAKGEPLDKESLEALQKTMLLLTNPAQREKEIGKSDKARQADTAVKSLGGNDANTQKIYELAAKVMASIAQQSNGDPQKMMQLLEQAQKDPSAFAASFTPEQKQMLKDLGAKIERTNASKKIP